MRAAYDVASVRAAESALMQELPEGTLMQRASFGLARTCAALLTDVEHGVAGARIVLLVGSGNNGADALYAGAFLARRGAQVIALLLSDHSHDGAVVALRMAGGRARTVTGPDDSGALAAIARAALVMDGIVGIGGSGPLRGPAIALARAARDSGSLLVAVDIPSGVDSDTGLIADPDACIYADVTVTFGCLKQGLVISPGREAAGAVVEVDIGLDDYLPAYGVALLDGLDVASALPEPQGADYKYSRGIVGIMAGSGRYRGAARLGVGGARQGGVGKVHFADRGDGVAAAVVQQFWDVTSSDAPPADCEFEAWVIGPGLGNDEESVLRVREMLALEASIVFDADALRVISGYADVRAALIERGHRGDVSVLTPHVGEFRALGFGDALSLGRLGAAQVAARELGAIVVLKGPGTVIAAPDGTTFVDSFGGAELGTAGTGDILAGIVGSMLAAAQVRGEITDSGEAARIVAAAVGAHGAAGALAAADGRPVTAMDVVDALPDAIALLRRVME